MGRADPMRPARCAEPQPLRPDWEMFPGASGPCVGVRAHACGQHEAQGLVHAHVHGLDAVLGHGDQVATHAVAQGHVDTDIVATAELGWQVAESGREIFEPANYLDRLKLSPTIFQQLSSLDSSKSFPVGSVDPAFVSVEPTVGSYADVPSALNQPRSSRHNEPAIYREEIVGVGIAVIAEMDDLNGLVGGLHRLPVFAFPLNGDECRDLLEGLYSCL